MRASTPSECLRPTASPLFGSRRLRTHLRRLYDAGLGTCSAATSRARHAAGVREARRVELRSPQRPGPRTPQSRPSPARDGQRADGSLPARCSTDDRNRRFQGPLPSSRFDREALDQIPDPPRSQRDPRASPWRARGARSFLVTPQTSPARTPVRAVGQRPPARRPADHGRQPSTDPPRATRCARAPPRDLRRRGIVKRTPPRFREL